MALELKIAKRLCNCSGRTETWPRVVNRSEKMDYYTLHRLT